MTVLSSQVSEYEQLKVGAQILDALVTLLLVDDGLSMCFEELANQIEKNPETMDDCIAKASAFLKKVPRYKFVYCTWKARGFDKFLKLTQQRLKELKPLPPPTEEERARWGHEWNVERPIWIAKYRERKASMTPEEWRILSLKVRYGCAKYVEEEDV